MNDNGFVLSSNKQQCSGYSLTSDALIHELERTIESAKQTDVCDEIDVSQSQISAPGNKNDSIIVDGRFTTITPLKPGVARKSRRFLFTSSSEIIDSHDNSDVITPLSSRFVGSKCNNVSEDFLRFHQSHEEKQSPKSDPQSFGLRREAPIYGNYKNGASRGKGRSKSLSRTQSHVDALQSSPYSQVLVCPHYPRRLNLTSSKVPGKGSRWKKLRRAKDKKRSCVETSSAIESNRLPSHRRSNVNEKLSVTQVKKTKSFVVVTDSCAEKQPLDCSFVMDILASFVQQGLSIESSDVLKPKTPVCEDGGSFDASTRGCTIQDGEDLSDGIEWSETVTCVT